MDFARVLHICISETQSRLAMKYDDTVGLLCSLPASTWVYSKLSFLPCPQKKNAYWYINFKLPLGVE